MKKIYISAQIAVLFVVLLSLCSCGKINESMELTYGEKRTIEHESFSKYNDLEWQSSDTTIVEVSDGAVEALAPGEAIVTASSSGNEIAEYTITVSTIPIESLVLSSNTCELLVDEHFKLDYILFPDNASNYGIDWKSADTTVAEVSSDGTITAKKSGQTTIIASVSGSLLATCSVNVSEKSAYDRLTDIEKDFTDACIEGIGVFKNPDSVVINAISYESFYWLVEIAAQNGFGGNTIDTFVLMEDIGFCKAEDVGLKKSFKHDKLYDLDLINQAIDELR